MGSHPPPKERGDVCCLPGLPRLHRRCHRLPRPAPIYPLRLWSLVSFTYPRSPNKMRGPERGLGVFAGGGAVASAWRATKPLPQAKTRCTEPLWSRSSELSRALERERRRGHIFFYPATGPAVREARPRQRKPTHTHTTRHLSSSLSLSPIPPSLPSFQQAFLLFCFPFSPSLFFHFIDLLFLCFFGCTFCFPFIAFLFCFFFMI